MIVSIRNRQKLQPVDTRFLREIAEMLLREEIGAADWELGVHLVGPKEMAKVNQDFLQHEGSTDVITFDHALVPATKGTPPNLIHGELFICVEDAMEFAERFRTSWQSEVVRYLAHGLLHLCGYDDLEPALKREMKRRENKMVRNLESRVAVGRLKKRTKRGRR